MPGESRGPGTLPRGQQPRREQSEHAQPTFAARMRNFLSDAAQDEMITRSEHTPQAPARRLRTIHIVFEDEADAVQAGLAAAGQDNEAQRANTDVDDLWWNSSLGLEPE